MAIADRAAAFLGRMGAAVPPSVSAAAGNSLQQMRSVARHATQSASGFLGQVGTTVGQAVAGSPGGEIIATAQPRYRAGKGGSYVPDAGRTGVPYVGALSSTLPTSGMLGAVGMKDAAARMQTAMQNPANAQAVGAGVVGLGAAGLGIAGSAIMSRKKGGRKAGEDLGRQLGVQMPSSNFSLSDPAFQTGVKAGVLIGANAGKGPMQATLMS